MTGAHFRPVFRKWNWSGATSSPSADEVRTFLQANCGQQVFPPLLPPTKNLHHNLKADAFEPPPVLSGNRTAIHSPTSPSHTLSSSLRPVTTNVPSRDRCSPKSPPGGAFAPPGNPTYTTKSLLESGPQPQPPRNHGRSGLLPPRRPPSRRCRRRWRLVPHLSRRGQP